MKCDVVREGPAGPEQWRKTSDARRYVIIVNLFSSALRGEIAMFRTTCPSISDSDRRGAAMMDVSALPWRRGKPASRVLNPANSKARLSCHLLLGFLAVVPTATLGAPHYDMLFGKIWSTVDENFYDPNFDGVDWKAMGETYRPSAITAKNDQEFAHIANSMLARLHASHLFLTQPDRDSTIGGVGIGATTQQIEGKSVVTQISPLSDAAREGLLVGDQLESPISRLYGPLGAKAELQVVGCNAKIRNLFIRREVADWPPKHPGFEWQQIEVKPGIRIGYIRVERFDDGASDLADWAMRDLKDTSGIIIDVRPGGGGNLSSIRLTSYFSGGPKPVVALLSRPYLQQLGHPVSKADLDRIQPTLGAYTNAAIFQAIKDHGGAAMFSTENVGAARYKGPVVVVVGPRTGSAGEGFAAQMRNLAGARLIGEPTMGYVLSSDRFDLGNGWTLTVPVGGNWLPDGTQFNDVKTLPDVEVATHADDTCRSRDLPLQAAKDVLMNEIQKRKATRGTSTDD